MIDRPFFYIQLNLSDIDYRSLYVYTWVSHIHAVCINELYLFTIVFPFILFFAHPQVFFCFAHMCASTD